MNNRNNLIFIVLLLIFPSLLYAGSSEEATKLVVRFGNYLNSWSRNPGDIEARDGLKLICNNGQNMRVADRLALEKCTTTDDNTILLGSYLRIFEDRHNEKIDYIIYNPKVEKVATKYATDNTNIISVVADVEVKSVSLNYMMKNVFYIKDNKICFIGDYEKETTKTKSSTSNSLLVTSSNMSHEHFIREKTDSIYLRIRDTHVKCGGSGVVWPPRIFVESNIDWEITSSSHWVHGTKKRTVIDGIVLEYIELKADENPSTSKRAGSIIVKAGDLQQCIEVSQDARNEPKEESNVPLFYLFILPIAIPILICYFYLAIKNAKQEN